MPRTYHLGPARRAVNVVVTSMLRIGIGAMSAYLLTTTGRNPLGQDDVRHLV